MKTFNFKIVFYLSGILLLMNTFFMFLCVIFSLIWEDGLSLGFLFSAIITGTIGGSMYFSTKKTLRVVRKREGYLIVSVGWLLLILTGTLPYFFSIPNLPLSVYYSNEITTLNLFYETVSGYTATGTTIFNNIDYLPKSILFWRSLTHWIGGMGIIVLTIAILPILGIGGMQLFSAEYTGGVSPDKVHPRIADTAKNLWFIYIMLTFVEVVLLYFAGMNLFDAVNHSFSTLSSGGFSTKDNGIAYWRNNVLIQYILAFFMMLSGTNFIILYFLSRLKWRQAWKNEEFKTYLVLVAMISIIVAFVTYFHYYKNETFSFYNLEKALRFAFFHTTSIISTTGFVVSDYTMITPFVTLIFFSLFFVGGSAGSTAGGVKIIRQIILLKNSIIEFKRLLHPNAVIPVRYGGKAISRKIVYNILAFFVMYMFIWISSSILFSLLNDNLVKDYESIISSLSVSASALSNVGSGIGVYGPANNMEGLTDAAKLLCSFLMIIGRLEIFTFLIIFTPYFWKSN
ncbi:TrkH family potassium uptake protein [Vaginella massiliensis]|uniref:TrkH family potassium uptake protein n=1 Tax=Vaginella massiliensis TaxID=1816680 RepID=UPI0008386683|nr:TrkH family potassium uptake protein [Vaginella massiliensis]